MNRFVHIATRSLLLAWVVGAQPALAATPPTGTGDTAPTSVADKLAYAQEAVAKVESATQAMEAALAKARAKGGTDAVKTLVPRVTAAQALRTVVQQSLSTMQEAAEAGETAKVDFEYRKITVAMSKAQLLLAETQRNKQQGAASGSTQVNWDDSAGYSEPFEEGTIEDTDISQDPPQVSPFL